MKNHISERINKIEEYTPSEAVYKIRLDANENPYPLPPDIAEEFRTALAGAALNRYPDPYACELRRAFAEAYGIPAEYTVAGNGSDELIGLLLNTFLTRGDAAAVTKPDFSMYAFYCSLIGCDIKIGKKSGDGGIDFDELASLAKDADCKAVIFSNPCNPTGRAYDRETILSFVRSLDCTVIVDEAYMEFCREDCSVLDMCGRLDNLTVLKTLSKAFGGAGLRAGFSVSTPEVASALRKVKSPYNLGSVPQLFGRILLNHSAEAFTRAKKIASDTQKLRRKLIEISEAGGGYQALPTDANFMLLSFKESGAATKIYEELKKSSIIVRRPDPLHLRVTCGTEAENAAFLGRFEEIIKTGL